MIRYRPSRTLHRASRAAGPDLQEAADAPSCLHRRTMIAVPPLAATVHDETDIARATARGARDESTMTTVLATRSPPRRPVDDYPPPRGRYEDPYRRDFAPPPPADPYANSRPREYPPREYPPRDGGYPRDGYPRDYDRGRYW